MRRRAAQLRKFKAAWRRYADPRLQKAWRAKLEAAAALFAETHHDGRRRWAGVSWWSYHRPSWRNVMLWATPAEPAPLTLQSVQPLTLSSIAVIEAARALSKPLP